MVDRKVTPEVRQMAERAKEWMASPKGQQTVDKIVESTTAAEDRMRDAQRAEIERPRQVTL